MEEVETLNNILTFIHEQLKDGLFPWSAQNMAAERFACSHAEVEELALENGMLPARYQRNQKMISTAEQLLLFRSRIAVIGCGGLGGYVIEELARLGVGRIIAIDPDVFEEHNLNRQLLATPKTLGQGKGIEKELGNPAFTPAVIASLQVAEACKIVLGKGELLRRRKLSIDLLDMEIHDIQ